MDPRFDRGTMTQFVSATQKFICSLHFCTSENTMANANKLNELNYTGTFIK